MPRPTPPSMYTRRIQRLLALVNEIKTNPRQEPRLLCQALGVSRAMLYKDRQVLAQVGFTFRYDRGQRQHVIMQDRFLPVLQLTSSEVLALIIGKAGVAKQHLPWQGLKLLIDAWNEVDHQVAKQHLPWKGLKLGRCAAVRGGDGVAKQHLPWKGLQRSS